MKLSITYRQAISRLLQSRPRILAFIFQLLNFSFSILIYKIIKIRGFNTGRLILNRLVYKPTKCLAHRLNKDLIIYNSRFRYYFILEDHSSYSVMMLTHEGDVPEELFRILNERGKEAVFIDVGAHQGSYVLAFAPYCKLVVAIEPHPKNYEILLRNLRINRISNCITVRCAASSYDGEVIFYTSQFSDLHSIHKWQVENARERIKVTAYKLDTLLLQKLELKSIDLVKIDVEGAELEVLEGMQNIIQKNNPIIIIEVFQRNLDKVEAYFKRFRYIYRTLYESVDPITYERYRYFLAYPSPECNT